MSQYPVTPLRTLLDKLFSGDSPYVGFPPEHTTTARYPIHHYVVVMAKSGEPYFDQSKQRQGCEEQMDYDGCSGEEA